MAMIHKPQIPAYTVLLFAAVTLNAQEAPPTTPEEQIEQDAAPEFVQESQIVPVAEEDIDEGVEDAAVATVPASSEIETLASEFALFKELMSNRVFDEADTVAKRVVELAIRIKGPQSNEFAKALTNLAIVQHQTEQYDAAQQNFQDAIEIIEDNEDRLNAQLVNPLRGLGAAQLESGRPDLAAATFGRAVHVTHVNEGPHNLDQVELLESLAETNVRMGELDAAKDVQDQIYALNIRHYKMDTLEIVPTLMRRAAWQHQAGLVYDERTTYRRAIRIIEDFEDKQSLKLVEPLIRLGRSFFFPDMSGDPSFYDDRMTTGEVYFRRAARIAAENPDSTWQIITQASLALGDYYMYSNNAQRARQVYSDVWELLSEDETRLDVRREQLESVVPLQQQGLPQYVDSSDASGSLESSGLPSDDPLLRGTITMTYEISERGRAKDVKLIEAEPAEFTELLRYVQREMRQRLYRPRFENGEVVVTPDQILAHTFFYRQSDLDAARAEADEE